MGPLAVVTLAGFVVGFLGAVLPGFDLDKLDVKAERGAWRDQAGEPAVSIREVRCGEQGSLSSNLHPLDPFIPCGDDAPGTQRELQRMTTEIGRIKARPILQPSFVLGYEP